MKCLSVSHSAEFNIRGELIEGLEVGGNLTLIARNYDTSAPCLRRGRYEQPQLRAAGRAGLKSDRAAALLRDGIIRSAESGSNMGHDRSRSLMLAGKNLTDRNYVPVDGFPEEGRNFTGTLRVRN
jgi:hypothetical protein